MIPTTDISIIRDWWLFGLGALIGLIVKIDEIENDKNSLYYTKNYKVHWGWLAVTMLLASIKGALVLVGAYVVIRTKTEDPMVALVAAGVVAMSFDRVWRYVRKRTVQHISRMESGVDQDDLFR